VELWPGCSFIYAKADLSPRGTYRGRHAHRQRPIGEVVKSVIRHLVPHTLPSRVQPSRSGARSEVWNYNGDGKSLTSLITLTGQTLSRTAQPAPERVPPRKYSPNLNPTAALPAPKAASETLVERKNARHNEGNGLSSRSSGPRVIRLGHAHTQRRIS
jgi:hypothetical protein